VRRALAGLVVLALVVFLAPSASAASDVAGAAPRLNAAETALAKAEAEVGRLKAQTDAASAKLRGALSRVRAFAVRRYIDSGQSLVQWLGEADASQAMRKQSMLRLVLVGDADAVAEYRTARVDLDAARAAIEQRLAAQQDAVKRLRKERADIAAELAKLAKAAEAEARKKAAASRNRSAASAASTRTVAVTGNWTCPVAGPHAFSNDWHQPRSGGRLHQGTDILAPRGTPVVANVSGTVNRHSSSLGGQSYYLRGDDGNTYYGAHLQSYAAQGRVAIGTVIGYVGTSGNASGGPPHLHFEIHPGGGAAVNPYPTLVRYC
jgi:murein DD-endopeptidase MepM/ murein hydrolase activator NlpD